MRVHIHNATLIDGQGTPPIQGASLCVEDHRIIEILQRPVSPYDRSDTVIDARGGFVLPGLVNHHAHGMTQGPLMIVGEPPLSRARVMHNLERQLAEGVTTALDVDGFATTEDAIAVGKVHPMNVRVATLHTPTHLRWVIDGPFSFGGVSEHHRTTAAEQIAAGAVAVGETGPGLDGHWLDYKLIPEVLEARTGAAVTMNEAKELREMSESGEWTEVTHILSKLTAGRVDLATWKSELGRIEHWSSLARAACEEAVSTAEELGVPVIFHHTPATFELIADAAANMGPRVIAAHSNFQARSSADAVRRAENLRAQGALVDVMTGDAFGTRQFYPTPEIMFSLFREGLVDLISTDYCGGYWDPMLRVVAEAAAANVLTIEDGVRMVTSRPADAIPGLAPDRGRLSVGSVADILITEPGNLATVELVLISGHVFVPDDNPKHGMVSRRCGCGCC